MMFEDSKQIAAREAQMILELTGNDVSDWFIKYVAKDAEEASKSIADYVPNVGYNVVYYSTEKIREYIESQANIYIRLWWQSVKHDGKSE